jgi:uncharacterized protein (DUF433 family)
LKFRQEDSGEPNLPLRKNTTTLNQSKRRRRGFALRVEANFFSRHRQFIKDFLDDRFAGFFLGLGFPLAAEKVWCHLVVMSNAQLLARITMDADICHGKPCIRGLRYPVEWLLELLSGDMTEPQILADYPDLEAADLRAAIAYAARLSRIKSIEPVAA